MNKFLFLVCFCFFTNFCYGQDKVIDSLKSLSFEELARPFKESSIDTLTDVFYAKAYLLKAKGLNDSVQMANAYYYLSELSSLKKGLVYSDSIILMTKNVKNSMRYPENGYLRKGNFFCRLGNYKNALSEYINSLKIAQKKNNQKYILLLNNNISVLKKELGDKTNFLNASRSYLKYLEGFDDKDNRKLLMIQKLIVIDAYHFSNKIDSALIYIEKGIENTMRGRDRVMYSNFLLRSGINSFKRNDFLTAIDSLHKSDDLMNEGRQKAYVKLYLGKSYLSVGKKKKGFFYLLKLDEYLNKTDDINIDFIKIYRLLIEYYKENKDIGQQIYFLNRLLRFDSISSSRNKFLFHKINEYYDVPNLLKEKESLIKVIEEKGESKKRIIILSVVFILLLLLYSFSIYQKNKLLKKRFVKVVEGFEQKKELENSLIKKKKQLNEVDVGVGISKELLEKIIENLEEFERSKSFIRKKYTLTTLAKELKTNSTYLSRVINMEKSTNFANYLNNLKVDYAIRRLTNDCRFRSYTIKAIAKECGFNNHQTFSKAFYKKTKLYPSYFIKKINKN